MVDEANDNQRETVVVTDRDKHSSPLGVIIGVILVILLLLFLLGGNPFGGGGGGGADVPDANINVQTPNGTQ